MSFIIDGCHRFLGRQILTAQSWTPKESLLKKYQDKLAALKGVEFSTTTEDARQLPAVRFIGKNCTETSPTIIFLNGAGIHFQSAIGGGGYEIKKWLEKGINVVCFNYYGTDLARPFERGLATNKSTIQDARAILNHVHFRFNVPQKGITLYAHSLGAGPGTIIAQEYEDVRICCDRTFTKLSEEIQALFGDGIVGKILARITRFFGWEFDVAANWDRIPANRKWLVYNEQDATIKPRVQLAAHARRSDLVAQRIIGMQRTPDFHHERPIDDAALDCCVRFMQQPLL